MNEINQNSIPLFNPFKKITGLPNPPVSYTRISPKDASNDVVIDIETIEELKECKEIISIHQNSEAKGKVIDLRSHFEDEPNDDIIIIMEEDEGTEIEKGNQQDSCEEHVALNMYAEMKSALKTIPVETGTTDKLSKIILDLKTYDSSLKILSNMFKTLTMKSEASLVKKVRGYVKYLQGVQSVKDGKLNFDINNLTESAVKRREGIGSVFTASDLLSNSLAFASEGLKSGIFTEYVSDYKENLEMIASLAGMPSTSLKLLYKLSSFHAALEGQAKVDQAKMHIQNVVVLRSGIEAMREVTKMALLLTGYSHPIIATTLAITGIATGAAGLYLTFNSK